MRPERITSRPEVSSDVKIDDVIAVLDKDRREDGSVQKAVDKLKKLLDDNKERDQP